ncbi:MAG: hypothetical protein ABI678_26130, partial [Kofleriaceae bacterium]
MKLRGRFTLTLALAALVPITIAAVITSRVLTNRWRYNFNATRAQATALVDREIKRLEDHVKDAAAALATVDQPFVGQLLLDLQKSSGVLNADAQRRLRAQAAQSMKGLSLDILTITGPDDVVLVSPHYRARIGDPNPLPVVRQRAEATAGKPFFTRDSIWTGHTAETVLVVESAQVARDSGYAVAVVAGKRVSDDLLAYVRGPGTDARIVAPNGEVILPPAGGDAAWQKLAKNPQIPMNGPDGKPVAFVEVAVSDGGLDQTLFNITVASALLALGALLAVVLIGALVARRAARDLDQLVE